MMLNCFAICAPGLIRSDNQDNLFINGMIRMDTADNAVFRCSDSVKHHGIYALADGMGGEKHGELASLIAMQGLNNIKPANGSRGMEKSLMESNALICDLITKNDGVCIGSTFAGLCIDKKNAEIVNIGDSRVYLLRDGELSQLSRDHTSIKQMIELGAVAAEDARLHAQRHKLTQHLGIFASEMIIEPYIKSLLIEANDLFLLCSDGLTEMLEDNTIASLLKLPSTIKDKAEALYAAALVKGGIDNITILLVHIERRMSVRKTL
ncbi:MAG: protein phosphatase 2C domain-containing protein [Clostridiales bacterium]|nr:protein phosphatase 2C domain-containing protein [Clostridiales bacterium]